MKAYQLAQKIKQRSVRSKFTAFGEDFGFNDILGCAEFLGSIVTAGSIADEFTSRWSENVSAD